VLKEYEGMRKWDGEMLVMLMEQGVEMLVERDEK
jgi:hypothetical protein